MFNKGQAGDYCGLNSGEWFCKKTNERGRSLTGKLIKIIRKEGEYDGKPTIKCNLTLQGVNDQGEPRILIPTFNMESWYCVGFFSRIHKVDLSKPFMLGVSGGEGDSKASFCWIKQEDNPKAENGIIKKDPDFADATKTLDLRPVKKKFGTKEFLDYSEVLKYGNEWINSWTANQENKSDPVPEHLQGQQPPAEDDGLTF